MASATVTIDLQAPPSKVWEVVSDLATTPRWRTTVESVSAPPHVELGSRMPATTRVWGKRWRWNVEVTAYESPRRIAYRTSGMATVDVEYVLEETPTGGTHFSFTGSSGSWLAPLMRRTLEREARQALENLRGIVDGEPEGDWSARS
jgi:uncharacterized protein YndB with AHSA1/START domain